MTRSRIFVRRSVGGDLFRVQAINSATQSSLKSHHHRNTHNSIPAPYPQPSFSLSLSLSQMALKAVHVTDVPSLDLVPENASLALCSSRFPNGMFSFSFILVLSFFVFLLIVVVTFLQGWKWVGVASRCQSSSWSDTEVMAWTFCSLPIEEWEPSRKIPSCPSTKPPLSRSISSNSTFR